MALSSFFSDCPPRIHLNMIGVRRAHQGAGLGRRLLDRVHEISRETEGSRGVSLTTELCSNLALYENVGYGFVEHANIGPDSESWGLFRAN